jgi:cell shape-determining protein MreD
MPDALAVQRITLRVFVVFAAYLAQVGLVDRMRLPLVGPNLLLLVVVSFALVGGRQRGAQLGFFAGLVADLLPPSDHLIGLFASFAAVAGGSMAMVLAYGGLGGLVGDDGVTAHATVHSLIGTVVYDVVLAPFVVPLVARTARRLEPVGPRSVGLH